ncbi:MAG: hypothetical protein R3B54_13335 [Bdellovibrionota bacterium]
MKSFFAMVRKEAQVQARHRGALWSLLVGPLVSVGTVTVIYAGLFRSPGGLQLGEMAIHNFLPFVDRFPRPRRSQLRLLRPLFQNRRRMGGWDVATSLVGASLAREFTLTSTAWN